MFVSPAGRSSSGMRRLARGSNPREVPCDRPERSLLLPKNDVSHGALTGRVLDAFVAQRAHVEAFEQMFAFAKEDGREDEVQFVDESRADVLADDRDATAEPHILSTCGALRLFERALD